MYVTNFQLRFVPQNPVQGNQKTAYLFDKRASLELRMIDMKWIWQLIGEAIVIIKFNAHAHSSAEMGWVIKLSQDDWGYVYRFNKNTQQSALDT